jgi:ribonuclease PH
MTFTRTDDRAFDELRAVKITPDFVPNAEGSALIEMGNTRVICAASVEDKLPPHLRAQRKHALSAKPAAADHRAGRTRFRD